MASPAPVGVATRRSSAATAAPALFDGRATAPQGRARAAAPLQGSRRGPVVVHGLDLDARPARPQADPLPEPATALGPADGSPAAGKLPLGRLVGLAGSGAFAFWTSLTCFVC